MGNSQSNELPEIANFTNVPNSPIRGVHPNEFVALAGKMTCFVCAKSFGSKKGNCNGCGEVICSDCSYTFDVQPDNKPLSRAVRVCSKCMIAKRIISCDQCSESMEAGNYLLHEESVCEHRFVICPRSCGAKLKAKDENNHMALCPNRFVSCTEGCMNKVPYSEMEFHLQNDCAEKRSCPHGCNVFMVPSKVAAHIPNCICRPTRCFDCDETVPLNRLHDHTRNSCSERIVICVQACNIPKLKAKDLANHMNVFCANRFVPCQDKCGKQIPLPKMKEHLSTNCTSRVVCRYGCSELVAPSLFHAHSTVCICRPVPCPQCKLTVEHSNLTTHTNNECVERIVPCSQNCGEKNIKDKDLFLHVTNACSNRIVRCPDGCDTKVMFCRVREHLTDSCTKRTVCVLGCNQKVSSCLKKDHEVICPCRLVFCDSCLRKVPLDRLQTHNLQECQERPVFCTQGCNVKPKSKDLTSHLIHTCLNRSVPCDERCGQQVVYSQMKGHLRSTCTKRLSCRFGCGQSVASSLFDTEHASVCTNRPSMCTHCRKPVPLNELPLHLLKVCAERVIVCPQGCKMPGIKAKTLPHHMTMLCQTRWTICSDGCTYQLKYCQMILHLSQHCATRVNCSFECGALIAPSLNAKHASECPKRPVCCPKCVISVPFHTLSDHQNNSCDYRFIKCSLGCTIAVLKAKNEVDHLKNDCPLRTISCIEYCGEQVKFCEMEKHVNSSCRSLARCSFSCGSMVRPSLMDYHKANQCSRRPENCLHCKKAIPHENLPHHQKICDQRPEYCTLSCGQKVALKTMEMHLKTCNNRLVDCPENCGAKLKHCNVNDHISKSCPNSNVLCISCHDYVKSSRMAYHDREECGRSCPKKHKLTLTLRVDGYKCDKCRDNYPKGYSMTCIDDDYDVCPDCYPNVIVNCPHSCRTSLLTFRTINDHIKTNCPSVPAETCSYCKANFSRNSIQSHQQNCSRRPTKIQCALQTMSKFLDHVMKSHDRCSVAAFNDEYNQLCTLKDEATALRALQYCVTNCCGGTHLWDSIRDAVMQFLITAERNRTWVLVLLTDGDDQGSRCSIQEAATWLTAFNEGKSNFTFVVGLGTDVNEVRLKQLCSTSGSTYLKADDGELLEVAFALAALRIVGVMQVDIASIGVDAAFARVRTERQLARAPVELLLLVDTSGSMNEKH
jgi:Mg-chelatase subunit ChlD